MAWHGMRSDIEHNDRQNRRLVDAILDGADAKPIKELEAEVALRDPHHDRGGLRRRPGFGEEVRIIPAGAIYNRTQRRAGWHTGRRRDRPEGVDIRSGQGTAN